MHHTCNFKKAISLQDLDQKLKSRMSMRSKYQKDLQTSLLQTLKPQNL